MRVQSTLEWGRKKRHTHQVQEMLHKQGAARRVTTVLALEPLVVHAHSSVLGSRALSLLGARACGSGGQELTLHVCLPACGTLPSCRRVGQAWTRQQGPVLVPVWLTQHCTSIACTCGGGFGRTMVVPALVTLTRIDPRSVLFDPSGCGTSCAVINLQPSSLCDSTVTPNRSGRGWFAAHQLWRHWRLKRQQ